MTSSVDRPWKIGGSCGLIVMLKVAPVWFADPAPFDPCHPTNDVSVYDSPGWELNAKFSCGLELERKLETWGLSLEAATWGCNKMFEKLLEEGWFGLDCAGILGSYAVLPNMELKAAMGFEYSTIVLSWQWCFLVTWGVGHWVRYRYVGREQFHPPFIFFKRILHPPQCDQSTVLTWPPNTLKQVM